MTPVARILVAAFAGWWILVGCNRQGEVESAQFPSLTFTLTDSLVDPRIVDSALGISYRPPRRWVAIAQGIIDSVADGIVKAAGVASRAIPTAGKAYFDSTTRATLLLVRLSSSVKHPAGRIAEAYEHYFHQADSSASISTTSFRRDPFRVHQLIVASPTSVVLKMIFEAAGDPSSMLELDCVVPQTSYRAVSRTIESVVASLQIHNPTFTTHKEESHGS